MSQAAFIRRAAIVTAAALSLATALPAQDAVINEIMKLEDQWAAATMKRDGATVSKMLSDDFLSFTGSGVLNSKAQMVKSINDDTTRYVSGANSGYKAKVHGNTVVVVGVFQVTMKSAKGNVTERHAWTDTWIRQGDGRWLCVASQATQVK